MSIWELIGLPGCDSGLEGAGVGSEAALRAHQKSHPGLRAGRGRVLPGGARPSAGPCSSAGPLVQTWLAIDLHLENLGKNSLSVPTACGKPQF